MNVLNTLSISLGPSNVHFKQNNTWSKKTIQKSKSTDRLTTQNINLAQTMIRG